MVGPRLVFIVVDGDVDIQGGETTEGVARQAARMLAEALGAEREQRSVRLLLRSLLLAAVATAIAAGVLWLFVRARRAAHLGVARIRPAARGFGCGEWTSAPSSVRRCGG